MGQEFMDYSWSLSANGAQKFLSLHPFIGVFRPVCSALLHYLPILWEESANHNMLRCAILTTLVYIVQGRFFC